MTRQRQIEKMRRDFISNVSHELRTPLAALKALTETLQAGALEDPPAAHRFLEQMETEVDSLSLMVTELLGALPHRIWTCTAQPYSHPPHRYRLPGI